MQPGCKEVWGWGTPPAAAPWGLWIPWPGVPGPDTLCPTVAEWRPREAAPGGKGPGPRVEAATGGGSLLPDSVLISRVLESLFTAPCTRQVY